MWGKCQAVVPPPQGSPKLKKKEEKSRLLFCGLSLPINSGFRVTDSGWWLTRRCSKCRVQENAGERDSTGSPCPRRYCRRSKAMPWGGGGGAGFVRRQRTRHQHRPQEDSKKDGKDPADEDHTHANHNDQPPVDWAGGRRDRRRLCGRRWGLGLTDTQRRGGGAGHRGTTPIRHWPLACCTPNLRSHRDSQSPTAAVRDRAGTEKGHSKTSPAAVQGTHAGMHEKGRDLRGDPRSILGPCLRHSDGPVTIQGRLLFEGRRGGVLWGISEDHSPTDTLAHQPSV